jgi:hypothetical protein
MHSIFAPPKECRCDVCKYLSRIRICPHCRKSIPFGAGEIDEHIIAVVGGGGSGKSIYITVLIQVALTDWVSEYFNGTIEASDPDTEKLFRTEYAAHLFEMKEVIPPTEESLTVTPFIFLLNFSRQDPITRRMINKPINIVFYDIPGELLRPENVGATIATEYLFHSSGIIYLVNPLDVREIATLMPEEEVDVPVITPDVMLSFIKKRIQERMGLRPGEQISIPLAVCLSQSDHLRDNNDELGFAETLFQPHLHRGAFDTDDFEFVNEEIQDKLRGWKGMANQIRQFANSFFKTKGFFASSALGDSPIGGHVEEIKPIRIEDPFLWILSELGVIKKTKG